MAHVPLKPIGTARSSTIDDRAFQAHRDDLAKRKALPKEVERVTFNAITKATVTEAMKHPRGLDTDLIDARQVRRVNTGKYQEQRPRDHDPRSGADDRE